MSQSPPLHPDNLGVLTVLPFEELDSDQQAHAVEWARAIARFEAQSCAGRKNAAGQPSYPEQWLTRGYPLDYYRHIVEPARTQGVVNRDQAGEWWIYLRGNPKSFDQRVITFLEAWELEGRGILSERAGAADGS